MTCEEFKIWIQGFRDLSDHLTIDEIKLKMIQSHAELCKTISGELSKDIEVFLAQCQVGEPVPDLALQTA